MNPVSLKKLPSFQGKSSRVSREFQKIPSYVGLSFCDTHCTMVYYIIIFNWVKTSSYCIRDVFWLEPQHQRCWAQNTSRISMLLDVATSHSYSNSRSTIHCSNPGIRVVESKANYVYKIVFRCLLSDRRAWWCMLPLCADCECLITNYLAWLCALCFVGG